MKYLEQIAQMIIEAGFAEAGSIFVNTMPSDVSKGVMLRPPLTGIEIDEGMRGHYEGEFLVIVRDSDTQAGIQRADAISGALKARNLARDGVYYTWLRPTELPVNYPRGESDETETSFPVQIGFAYT